MPATSLAPKRVVRAARTYLSSLWSRREFAWYLAMGNLKARNASTALGLFWWVLNPLLLGSVYWFVFGLLFDRSDAEGIPFMVYLLSGMFPFYFTRTALTGGVNSIVNNAQLLTNLRFPRAVLPIASLLEGFIGFMTSLAAYFLIVGFSQGIWPDGDIVWLAPTILVHVVFNLGLSMLVARLAVPFRDLNNLIPYLTRMWLYLSPILYGEETLSKAPEWAQSFAKANPLLPILNLYRIAMAGVGSDPVGNLVASSMWAVAVFVLGTVLFIKYEGRMARYL